MFRRGKRKRTNDSHEVMTPEIPEVKIEKPSEPLQDHEFLRPRFVVHQAQSTTSVLKTKGLDNISSTPSSEEFTASQPTLEAMEELIMSQASIFKPRETAFQDSRTDLTLDPVHVTFPTSTGSINTFLRPSPEHGTTHLNTDVETSATEFQTTLLEYQHRCDYLQYNLTQSHKLLAIFREKVKVMELHQIWMQDYLSRCADIAQLKLIEARRSGKKVDEYLLRPAEQVLSALKDDLNYVHFFKYYHLNQETPIRTLLLDWLERPEKDST